MSTELAVAIRISVEHQRLCLVQDGRILCSYAISTALNGVGERQGSGCTPRGLHRVRAKVGAGCAPGVNRGGAVDTLRRFIYIHGCPDGLPMGIPASHGCVRMRNADVIALFDRVAVGTRVRIEDLPLGG